MKTASSGCYMGMSGIAGGLAATIVGMNPASVPMATGLMLVGGAGGLALGSQVSPMALPQTVAGFHSLVGFRRNIKPH